METQEVSLTSLLGKLCQQFPYLQRKYHVETLEVFGSYVRAEQKPSRDLDLLVSFTELPSFFTYIE